MEELGTNFYTIIATGASVVALIYAIVRNFKMDVKDEFDKLEQRITILDERMFFLSTGKTLAQAIKEQIAKDVKGLK